MSTKQAFRVRTQGLRKAEELSIAVFLRFVGQSEKGRWTLSNEPGAELALSALDTPPGQAQANVIAWVADAEATPPADGRMVLRRPLQVEAFGHVLRACENHLETRGVPVAAGLTQAVPQITLAVSAGQAVSPRLASLGAHATHRLVRWPGSEVLQNQRQRKILASFLVSRPLSLHQLVSLSGVSEAACGDFLRALAELNLLESHPAAGADAAPAASMAEPVHAPPRLPPPSAATGSLINRLRKRLGLS